MLRWILLSLLLAARSEAQVPDSGLFQYDLFDKGDHPVGSYHFSIEKRGELWLVTSDMDVDTRFLFFKVVLHDHNSFTHDGKQFRAFSMTYFKDVPLQKTLDQKVDGQLNGLAWSITSQVRDRVISKAFLLDDFQEIRNLVSRFIRPEAVLRPGESHSTLSLDPLTLTIDPVQSRGLREESVAFQGKVRRLFVMEQKAPDGDVQVKKFENGLIYRSETAEGYALLKSARTPDF